MECVQPRGYTYRGQGDRVAHSLFAPPYLKGGVVQVVGPTVVAMMVGGCTQALVEFIQPFVPPFSAML